MSLASIQFPVFPYNPSKNLTNVEWPYNGAYTVAGCTLCNGENVTVPRIGQISPKDAGPMADTRVTAG